MKLLIKFSIIALAILFTSCKKEVHDSSDDEDVYEPYIVTFTFNEEVTIIEVDENVTSFRIAGTLSDNATPKYIENLYVDVKLDKENTTARHNVHFINVSKDPFKHSDGFNVYKEVKIIPENITSEVSIIYLAHNDIYDMETEIFTESVTKSVIKLVPKK